MLSHPLAISQYCLCCYIRALQAAWGRAWSIGKGWKRRRGPEAVTSLRQEDMPWGGPDTSTWPATKRIKLGINPFNPKDILLLLFSLMESIVNFPGAETPRQDICATGHMQQKNPQNWINYRFPSLTPNVPNLGIGPREFSVLIS